MAHELIHARRALGRWLDEQQDGEVIRQALECEMGIKALELGLPHPSPLIMTSVLRELHKLERMLGRRSASHG